MKLWKLSGEDIYFYKWFIRLTETLSVTEIMNLITDMLTDTKRSIRPDTLIFPPRLLYLSWTSLILLSPEVWRFAYPGIRWDCEGRSFSSLLCQASISTSRLITVGYCILLKCLTWLWWTFWCVNYPVECLRASVKASVPFDNTGSSVMTLGGTWGLVSGGRSWETGSCGYSFQYSLGKIMLLYSLIWNHVSRVNCFCVSTSECSSTMFFQFTGTVTFLMCSTVEKFPYKTTRQCRVTLTAIIFNTISNGPVWIKIITGIPQLFTLVTTW